MAQLSEGVPSRPLVVSMVVEAFRHGHVCPRRDDLSLEPEPQLFSRSRFEARDLRRWLRVRHPLGLFVFFENGARG